MIDPAIQDFMENQAEKRRREEAARSPRWWRWIKKNILKPMGDGFKAESQNRWRY